MVCFGVVLVNVFEFGNRLCICMVLYSGLNSCVGDCGGGVVVVSVVVRVRRCRVM